jgi:hypothetical protein
MESFSPVATDARICMIIGIFLYQLNNKKEDWVLEIRIGKANVCGMARRNCGVGVPNAKGTQKLLYPTGQVHVRKRRCTATVDENFLKTPEREWTNPKQGRSVSLLLKECKWRDRSTPDTICGRYTSDRKT